MRDPTCCGYFEQAIEHIAVGKGPIDDETDNVTKALQKAASDCFAADRAAPRKDWIRYDTWESVQHIAPVRRQLHANWVETTRYTKVLLFGMWRSTLTRHLCWSVHGCTQVWRAEFHASCHRQLFNLALREALLYGCLSRLQFQSKKLLKRDRKDFQQGLVDDAQKAAEHDDTRQVYKIVKQLAGVRPRPLESVKLKDGQIAYGEDAIQARLGGALCRPPESRHVRKHRGPAKAHGEPYRR